MNQPVSFRLPLARPRWTYVLMALNFIVFIAMTVVGMRAGVGLNGSLSTRILLQFGAMNNPLIAAGDYYRLFTSMFLHIGLVHLFFNSYALYFLGQNVEQLYGNARFVLIYLLAGLGGSLASFVLGGGGVSAGASGAIFGLIGASIVYFYLHRNTLGGRGRAQLQNMLMVAGVNLLMGFMIPGINNLAHIGGLVFGMAVGWFLAPRYLAPSLWSAAPVAQDGNSIRRRVPALLLVVLVQIALLVLGIQRWSA